jgi:hypothetical protein
MSYRHAAARIHEIVKAPKALVAGQSVSPQKRGSRWLRRSLTNGRDRYVCGHAACASRWVSSRHRSFGIPRRSGEWKANEVAHARLGNRPKAGYSLAILTDRPEVGPCLRRYFRRFLGCLSADFMHYRHTAACIHETVKARRFWRQVKNWCPSGVEKFYCQTSHFVTNV